MRYFFMGLAVVLVAILLPVPQEFRPVHASATRQQPAERVILRINRNQEVAGFLALEDEDTITIRTLKGQVESFSKSRIFQIVRLVNPSPNQAGVVFLLDGQTRQGVIIEDAFEHVLIEIHGIRAKLKRETVSHVTLQPTLDQQYTDYKSTLKPGMYDAHLLLCRWLVDQRQYELAKQELDELLADVEMPEARQLLNLVNAQLALQMERRGNKSAPSRDPVGDAEPSAGDEETEEVGLAKLPDQILSKADVNLIRVYEIDFDRPPKVTITPDLVRAIIEHYGTSRLVPASQTERNAMFRAAASRPLEIVRLMFDLRARDLYSQIQVNSEPYSLNLFRERVHDTWLMNNCATSKCHGGPDAVGIFLHRKNFRDERVRYTNFLILERMQLDPEWPLINYERPEDSLIIQYALSRDDPTCRKPHPRVPGYAGGAIGRTNHRLKQDAVEWIRSMMSPRPEYPVELTPPIPPGTVTGLADSEQGAR